MPTLAGGLVLLNAALVDGPLGAFRLFSRRAHRIVDLVVIGTLVLLAVLPWLDVDNASRIMIAVRAVDPRVRVVELGVRAAPSRAERRRPNARSTAARRSGRSAGRAVGGDRPQSSATAPAD